MRCLPPPGEVREDGEDDTEEEADEGSGAADEEAADRCAGGGMLVAMVNRRAGAGKIIQPMYCAALTNPAVLVVLVDLDVGNHSALEYAGGGALTS